MNEQREIVKASWLQHVIHKKGGTLHRKKKVLYEEGKWVTLCVHNDRIPLLEWYFSEECAQEHRPSKVIDLLDSSFVRVVISDSSGRSFMIGFMDYSRDPVELCALTSSDCEDWIRSTTSTLIRLKCLSESTNLYISMNDFANVPPKADERNNEETDHILNDQIPEGVAPSPPFVETNTGSSEYDLAGLPSSSVQTFRIAPLPRTLSGREEKKSKRNTVLKTPPPLPPRQASSPVTQIPVTDMTRCSIYDNPNVYPSTSCRFSSGMEHFSGVVAKSHNSMYSTLETSALLDTEILAPQNAGPVKRGYSIPAGTLNIKLNSRRMTADDTTLSPNYDLPCKISNRISSTTIKANDKINSTVQSSNGNIQLNENNTNSQYIDTGNILPNCIKNITVQGILCFKHIAYMEYNEKVWISGWTLLAEKDLAGKLHVGDQLIRIGNTEINNVQQIPSAITTSLIGTSVSIFIRKIPHGTIFALQKSLQKFDAGFILDKHKIKLSDVHEGSSAWNAGIKATIPAITRTGSTCASITCINGHSLNLFSKNDEIFKQIDALPPSCNFYLIVQPYDFVKLFKKSLRKLKNFSDFVY